MNNFKTFIRNFLFIIGYLFIFLIIFNYICSFFVEEREYHEYKLHHLENRFIVNKEKVKDRYQVDENGFRNLDSYEKFRKLKNKDYFNIIFIGGSTTFGYRVKDNETFPYHFEEIIKKKYEDKKYEINVVNLGTHKYNFRDNLHVLQSLLLNGHYPDTVIFYNGVNERYEIKDFIVHGNKEKWEHRQAGNFELNILHDNSDKLHLEKLSSFIVLKKIFKHVVGFVNHRIIKTKNIEYTKSEALDDDFIDDYAESAANNYIKVLRAIEGLSITYSFKPIIFLQPTKTQYTDRIECWLKRKNGTSTFYRTENRDLRRKLSTLDVYYSELYTRINEKVRYEKFTKLIYQDITNIFKETDCSKNIIFITAGSHLSNFGNEFLAQIIYSHLKRFQLLDL